MRTFAMVRKRSSRRSSESAITPSPAIVCRQASTRNTSTRLGALSSAAIVGAPSHSSMKRSTDTPSESVNAVWMCSSRSLGCCTIAGAIAPSERTREKLMASIAAETSPNSSGLRTRASTATLPTVINPCSRYPEPIQTPLVRACPVRFTSSLWALEDVMSVTADDRTTRGHPRTSAPTEAAPTGRRPARGIGKRCPVSLQELDQTWSGGNAKYPVQTGAPQVTVNQENPDPLTREGDREVRRDHGLPLLRSCAGDKDRPLALAPSEQQAGIQQAKRLGSARQRGRVGDDFPRRLLATAGGLGPTAR